MWGLILSEQYFSAGSLDGLKATPNMFSLEEKSDMSWEILLFHLGVKQHIASSYNQGKTALHYGIQQKIGSDLFVTCIHLSEMTLAQMHLCSGKQPL